MAERLALKRLSGSDLALFEWHFRNKTYGDYRQKGINLNTDVFVDQFYPLAVTVLGTHWPVFLTIHGPGEAPMFAPPGDHRRPITYNNRKNWRLDGGTVDDPSLPERFRPLAIGDLALLRFRGDPAPTEVELVLIARSVQADAGFHERLNPLVPSSRRTMIAITAAQIREALRDVVVPRTHPLASVDPSPAEISAVEDMALGGGTPPAVLRRRRGGRRLTPGELAEARAEAGRIGTDGELLLNSWLVQRQEQGEINSLEWVSPQDAAAPYDFQFNTAGGQSVRLDAKSTEGPFERVIHISTGELIAASQESHRYGIARLHSIDEGGARVRIAEDISDFARGILTAVAMPDGVRVDSYAIEPRVLTWGEEFTIRRPAEAVQSE